MIRDALQAKIDELTAIRDALPLPDAELVLELTRVHMDGEHAADEDASNYEDASQVWRDVTASDVHAVLARLRELGWRAPDDPRPLPKGVTVEAVAEKLGLLEATWGEDATALLDLLNIEH